MQIDWGTVSIVLKTNPLHSSLRLYFCIVLCTKVWQQFITFDAVLEHILQRNQGHILCSHKWAHCTEHQSISHCVVLGQNESFLNMSKYYTLGDFRNISTTSTFLLAVAPHNFCNFYTHGIPVGVQSAQELPVWFGPPKLPNLPKSIICITARLICNYFDGSTKYLQTKNPFACHARNVDFPLDVKGFFSFA